MVIVKATPEELKALDAIEEKRRQGKPVVKTQRATGTPERRFYKKEDFQDEVHEEDQTSDVKPEPSQYPMKKDTPKKGKRTDDAPTGDKEVI